MTISLDPKDGTKPIEAEVDLSAPTGALWFFRNDPAVKAELARRAQVSTKAFNPGEARDPHTGEWVSVGSGGFTRLDPVIWNHDRLVELLTPTLGAAAAREVASTNPSVPKWVLRTPEGVTVVGSSATKTTPGQAHAALAGTIALLMAKDPKPGMQINIDSETIRRGDAGVSVVGDSLIHLDGKTLAKNAKPLSSVMPSGADHSTAAYTLAHEWGHSIMPVHGGPGAESALLQTQSLLRQNDQLFAVNAYGLSHLQETFAEAYAEWRLTGGQPKTGKGEDNHFVEAMAAKFGWKP